MKKQNPLVRLYLSAAIVLFASVSANAQVTIGSNSVPMATLDVVADFLTGTPAGVIPPRVDRQLLGDNASMYTAAQTGAVVYVTDMTGAALAAEKTELVTESGLHYFDGSIWQPLKGGGGMTTNVTVGDFNGKTFVPTEFTAQQTVYVHAAAGWTVTANFPVLTEADKGKIFVLSNRGTSGGITANLIMINQANGAPITTTLPGAIPINRSRSFMWIGNAWIETGGSQ